MPVESLGTGGADELAMRPVLTLTEEELLVLTDGSRGAVPARLQEPKAPAARELVRSVALRTLMARGLVLPAGSSQQPRPEPPGGGGPDPGVAQHPAEERQQGACWAAVEPLGLTLTLRDLAPTVLALRRVLGPLPADLETGGPEAEGTTAVRYLHLHDEIAVIEDVTDDGMHGFLTAFPERFPDAVADFIRPKDAVAGRGGVRSEDGSVDDLLEALGRPTVLVEASLVTGLGTGKPPPVPVGLMLVLGPGGTFRSHDSRTYHPVDPDGAISDLLRQALAGKDLTGEEQAGEQSWDQPDTGTEGAGSGAGAAGPT